MDNGNEEVLEKKMDDKSVDTETGFNKSMEKVMSLLVDMSGQLSSMETLFNKRIMHADYEDKVIDQLHAELQKYKEDLYSQLARPILLDIIEMRESIMRVAAEYL